MSKAYINRKTIRRIADSQRTKALNEFLKEHIGNNFEIKFKGNKAYLIINENKILEVYKNEIEDEYSFKVNIDSRKTQHSYKILYISNIIIQELINILEERDKEILI